MIYNNGITTIRLYGKVADNFLESVGVNIFDDGDIAIGESIFDLSTACDILEENGIFLYEDGIVLEGKQAEEYKARKAKEREDAEKAESDRNRRRYSKVTGYGMTHKSKQDDFDRKVASANIYGREAKKRAEDKINAERNLDFNKERSNNFKKKMSDLGPRPTGNGSSNIQKRNDWTRKYTAYRDEANKLDRIYLPRNRKDAEKTKLAYDRIMGNKHNSQDAINRHMRRHPKQYAKHKHESTIFSDIEII